MIYREPGWREVGSGEGGKLVLNIGRGKGYKIHTGTLGGENPTKQTGVRRDSLQSEKK